MQKHSISMHYDIEEKSISNLFISTSIHHDIEETSISMCKTSISVYTDIEDFLDIDKSFFDIHIRYRSFAIRYRMLSSSISVLFCLGYCSPCSVLDTYCRVNYSLRIKRLACSQRLWNRLTRAARRSESARSRVEMPFRSAPLKLPRRLTTPPPAGGVGGVAAAADPPS
jgi:hypothetical protein